MQLRHLVTGNLLWLFWIWPKHAQNSGFAERDQLSIRENGRPATVPGTAWARYDSRANVVTIHVLDLVDGPSLVRTMKDRYEAKLKEVFE